MIFVIGMMTMILSSRIMVIIPITKITVQTIDTFSKPLTVA